MAKLLNRPYTNEEKRQILDMLRGNINRISVSTDVEEIVCQLNFAVERLSAVAYSRIKEIREGDQRRRSEMERLTSRDEKGNLNVDGKEVYAGYLYNAVALLEEYEDTELTPEQIMELKEAVQKLENIFGDEITVNQVIDFFVDFYIAQGDPDRVEKAELLTNEEAAKWQELKERDTAKRVKRDADDIPYCPYCESPNVYYYEENMEYDFCPDCGQRLKWEE